MFERQASRSVAEMMRKHPTPAEAHLINPAWSPRNAPKNERPARPN